MKVTLHGVISHGEEDSAVQVETNLHAKVQTLVSAFCTKKGIAYSPKYAVFDAANRLLPLESTLQSLGVTNGQNLYIGYKSQSQDSAQVRWPLYVAVIALIVGAAGILTMSLVYGLHGGIIPLDYGIILDAGSSKTNTLLYNWPGNKYRGTGCVRQVSDCFVKGGIAKGSYTEKIPKIIDCVIKIVNQIDKNKRAETPLFFAATAGMRLLGLSNRTLQQEILDAMSKALNTTGTSVREVSVISGRDEGLYGWTTTNFLTQTLDVKNTDPFTPVTYGSLDLGGASTQIAFAIAKDDPNLNVTRLPLYGEDHDVFSMSYLCYGRDQAEQRYQAMLIKEQGEDETVISDPCAPNGFSKVLTADEILNQPCTLMDTYEEFNSDENRKYTFEGKSDYDECKKQVSKLIDKEICEQMEFKECFNKVSMQLENQKFKAFANFYYTTSALKMTNVTLTEYVNQTEVFCRKPFDVNSTNPYISQFCFNAQYIHTLLIDAYGFNITTWKNIEFLNKIRDIDLGWTLGYIINATNQIPSKKPTPRLIHPTVLTIFLVLFIIVVAATIVYIFHATSRKKKEASARNSGMSLGRSP